MAEAKVVEELAQACARGAETYGPWTTAKAVAQRRCLSSLSTRFSSSFSGCATLLLSLLRVLRTHLNVSLAQELLSDVLFPAVRRYQAKLQQQPSVVVDTGLGDAGAAAAAREEAVIEVFLENAFTEISSSITSTPTPAARMPCSVAWSESDDAVVSSVRRHHISCALPWVEQVLLPFALQATLHIAPRSYGNDGGDAPWTTVAAAGRDAPQSSSPASSSPAERQSRWAQHLFDVYEQLLALQLAQPHSGSTELSTTSAVNATALSQLLFLSVYSGDSRRRSTLAGGKNTDLRLRTPVARAVSWLTHCARRSSDLNRLFAQYVYYEVLRRGTAETAMRSWAPPLCEDVALMADEQRVNAALVTQAALTQQEALGMLRTAVVAYHEAFPVALQHLVAVSAAAAAKAGGTRDSTDGGAARKAYVSHCGWVWFVESLALSLAYSDGSGTSMGSGNAEKQQRLCQQLFATYADVVAEVPELQWGQLVLAYTAADAHA